MIKIIKLLKIILFIFLIALNENVIGQDKNIDTVYVISDKYTAEYRMRKEAREDISNGYILIFHGGWFGVGEKVDSIAHTFGFNFIRSGCSATEGDDYYNDEVVKYLNKRNGNGWWQKFLNEVSKLNLKEPPSLPAIKDN